MKISFVLTLGEVKTMFGALNYFLEQNHDKITMDFITIEKKHGESIGGEYTITLEGMAHTQEESK